MTSTPAGPSPEPALRTSGTAVDEIRRAEAARTLGLLDPSTLQVRAGQWLADGVDSPNVRALARANSETSDGIRLALLAEIAEENGVHFETTAEARALHASSVIAAMATSSNPTLVAMTFSNNYTDEVSSRIFRAVGRIFHRR